MRFTTDERVYQEGGKDDVSDAGQKHDGEVGTGKAGELGERGMGSFSTANPPSRDFSSASSPTAGNPDVAGMGQLLGSAPQGQSASADMQQQLQSATKRFEMLISEARSLAASYPTAKSLGLAMETLQRAVFEVTQEITKQMPPQPGNNMIAA